MKVFIIAGEKSGDLIGAEITSALSLHGVEVLGIGGEKMLARGLTSSLFEMNRLSLMGFLEVLPKVFEMHKLINLTVETILEKNPKFVITIDSPGFCTRVVALLRKRGFEGKIFHAVAPTVWAYKPERAKKFAKLYDKLFCILPFEPPFFEKEGLSAKYICYPPLFRLLPFLQNLKCVEKTESPKILLTLGSRRGEVMHHLEFASKTIKLIKMRFPKAEFFTATFPEFAEEIGKILPEITLITTEEEKIKMLKFIDFSISKSGTGAIETSFFEVPSLIFYKANILTFLIVKFLAISKFANIINVLLNKEAIPEFIQFKATPEKISAKVVEMLLNPMLMKKQVEDIKEAKLLLMQTPFTEFGKAIVDEIL